jgi:hypothetical protein
MGAAMGAGVAALAALAALVVAARPSGAAVEPEPSSSGVDLEAVAEFGSDHDPGDPVTVAVTVSSSRLVSGTLSVRSTGDGSVVSQPLDVAGGSVKAVRIVAPTLAYAENGFDVQYRVDDTVAASAKVRLTHDLTTSVAGLLPALAASAGEPPPKVNLGAGLGDVVIRELEPEVLELGVAAIDQLDHVLASTIDLSRLSPTALGVVQSWVGGGGRLLIDDTAGLDSLPEEWRPGPAGFTLVGNGEVRFTEGEAKAGNWKTILDPAPLALGDSPFGSSEFSVMPEAQLARRAGVTVPDLGTLLVVLAIYVVIVGPVLYLVLRRLGRLTLAWIAIPAVAALVAAGVLISGRSWRDSGEPAASTFIETAGGASRHQSMLLQFSRSGGAVRTGLPAGWVIAGQNPGFGSGTDGSNRTQTLTASGPTLEARLEAGQVVVFRSTGGGSQLGFEVRARGTGDEGIAGTVRNLTEFELHDVAVFAAGSVTLVGSLLPGGTADFRLEGVGSLAMIQNGPLGLQVWSDADSGFGNPFGDRVGESHVDLGLWGDVSVSTPGGLFRPGTVRVVGWTDERPSELGATVNTRTAISTVAPVLADGVPAPSTSVRSELVEWPIDGFGGGGSSYTWRFVVPPDALDGDYELDRMEPFTKVEVRTDEGWQQLVERGGGGYVIPAATVRRGAIVIRASLAPDQFFDVFSQGPLVRGLEAG